MSRREPLGWRAVASLVMVVTLIALGAAGLTWLRTNRPAAEVSVELPPAREIHGADLPVLDCESSLADSDAGGDEVVGAATSAAVVGCPDLFDPTGEGGPLVAYVGEVVGDVIARRAGTWLLVNDDDYALRVGPLGAHRAASGGNSGLAVYVPREVAAPDGLTPGRPDRHGDIVGVRGRVRRTDPLDGGGLTLHAEEIEVVVDSSPAEAPLHVPQAIVAAVGVAVAAGLTLWSRDRR